MKAALKNTSYFLLLIFLGTSINVYSQEYNVFRHISKSEGLSQNSVFSITQDDDGFMWFGTRDGLNRFDGQHFKVYRKDDRSTGSIISNDIRNLYFDSYADALWIGSFAGLSRYHKVVDTFTNYVYREDRPSLSSSTVRCIYRDRLHRLWVGTRAGLNRYDEELDQFYHVAVRDLASSSTGINAIYEDSYRRMWLATSNGLIQIEEDQTNGLEANLSNTKLDGYEIKRVLTDSIGNAWIATADRGLFYWRLDTDSLYAMQHEAHNEQSLSHDQIRSMAISPENELWIGTFKGLNQLITIEDGFRRYMEDDSYSKSLSHESVHSVFFDIRGGLWVGTYHGGVNYRDPILSKFNNYEYHANRNSISNNIVSAFAEDQYGDLWIGTEGGGLNFLDRSRKRFTVHRALDKDPNALSGDNVKALLADGDYLWIGTFGKGLNRFHIPTQRFQQFRHDPEDENSLMGSNVYNLLKEDDYLWILVYGNGINLYDQQTERWHSFTADDQDSSSLSSNLVRAIIKDRQGNIWVGSEHGLSQMLRENEEDTIVRFSSYLEDISIYTIYEDRHSVLWIGSFNQGLIAYDPQSKELVTYSQEQGMPGHTVYGIVEDDQGYLWLSTNNGISKFDPQKERFTNYDHATGLQNLEHNYNAYYKASSGELLFGGINGFSLFQPQDIVRNEVKPQLVFTDLRAMNKSILVGDQTGILQKSLNQTDQLTFQYNQANFTIGYAVLDYLNPRNVQTAHILEGIDNDWTHTVGQTEVTYTIQRHGEYTFRMKGANSDGVWSDRTRSLTIVVKPPPWLTGWAYLAYFVALTLISIAVARFVGLRHRLQLEQVAKKKEQDLNEDKIRFFTNMTHEFRTPLTLIKGPLDELIESHRDNGISKKLQAIDRNTRRLLNLVNQLLTFRKLETDHEPLQVARGNIVELVGDICQSFENYAQQKRITFDFDSELDQIFLWYDRDKIEKVFYNLLSNAFKFTPFGGSIEVQIVNHETTVDVKVSDTGSGIKLEEQQQVFKRFYEKASSSYSAIKGSGIGLAISKQMIELHHGKISLSSEENAGTIFTVELLKSKRHFPVAAFATSHNLIKNAQLNTDLIELESLLLPDQHQDKGVSESDKGLLLIVEDDHETQLLVKNIFSETYRLILASDGKEAIVKAQKHNPDLIISDISMPVMDGNQLCQTLKSNIKTSHIPIVLLTGHGTQDQINKGLENGADDYILKPFNPSELRLRIKNRLSTIQMNRQKFVRVLNVEPKEIAVTSADEEFISKALKIAEDNIDNHSFTVEQFAYEIAVSRPLLFTKLKALTNQTPNNFIKTIRLKRAAQLLSKNKLNVSEIAYRVGFKDPRYFSKCFQKQFGETPSQFADKPLK